MCLQAKGIIVSVTTITLLPGIAGSITTYHALPRRSMTLISYHPANIEDWLGDDLGEDL